MSYLLDNNTVKNTMKNIIGARKIIISNIFLALFPVPENWNLARTNLLILTPTT